MTGHLINLVNPQVCASAQQLAAQFAAARPFKHIVIDDFLDSDYCQKLIREFPEFDEQLAINEDGVVGAKAVREQIRDISPAYEQLDRLSSSEDFRELIGTITGIEALNHDPHYFGGGTHENREGQGLDAHVDFNYHPITREHRRLNLIVYLNPEWRDEWGGALQLHRDPYLPPSQDDIKVVTPLANRCVIFETNEYSWHGFKRIQLPDDRKGLSRKSFALYY
ncbi:MAG: 2OG-Fe(II) oxygenase, partial [Xanthomonadales bacterium]|nr:2OG-Fe(II) oxygenase [Xanthomonadales bacterium]